MMAVHCVFDFVAHNEREKIGEVSHFTIHSHPPAILHDKSSKVVEGKAAIVPLYVNVQESLAIISSVFVSTKATCHE